MDDYTPPTGNSVDFSFTGDYTPPAGNHTNFLYGIVALVVVSDVSRSSVYNSSIMPGFDTTTITWVSSEEGPYVIELGGTGHGTGDTLVSGTVTYNVDMETIITDDMLRAAPSYAGSDTYRLNIYVLSSDNIWTPQE